MMEALLDFFSFSDPNVSWVLVGMVLICASSSVVGTFTFLQKRALIGDTISHAILPGLCLAFMLTQSKHPLYLLIGATASGLLGLIAVNVITRRSPIKPDAALGIVLSVFYGLGIVLLTYIQRGGNAAQSGLDKFLFGKAASLIQADVITFALVSLVLLVLVALMFRPLAIITFDKEYAKSMGFPIHVYEGVLSLLTVVAIAVGIQAVGVVLMASLIIAPVVAARYWSHHLGRILWLAGIFAALCGVAGAFLSYTFPNMPTGPWVVVVLSLVAMFSIFFGSRKGYVVNAWRRKRYREKMLRENIMKCLYQLGEKHEDFARTYAVPEIQARRYMESAALKRGLRALRLKGWVASADAGWGLTPEGVSEGKRIVRIHRLWELYLTTFTLLPADHVHEDAEAIEHLITPELEAQLSQILAYPEKDPHASPIPYNHT